jgi:hypothetical protein
MLRLLQINFSKICSRFGSLEESFLGKGRRDEKLSIFCVFAQENVYNYFIFILQYYANIEFWEYYTNILN